MATIISWYPPDAYERTPQPQQWWLFHRPKGIPILCLLYACVCMCTRFQASPKEFHLVAIKRILWYLIASPHFGLCYPKGSSFNLVGYLDSDYAGDKVDRKSTSNTYQYLGRSLVCWSSRKKNSISLSTIETKYIFTSSCCAQFLWMRQTLKDYSFFLNHILHLCDSKSGIKIAHNPIQHSQTKHMDIHYHFIHDNVSKSGIVHKHVWMNKQLTDIFTKPLDEKTFGKLRSVLNILYASSVQWNSSTYVCI